MVGHVGRMGEERNAHVILNEKDHLEDLGVDVRILLTFWSRNYFFKF